MNKKYRILGLNGLVLALVCTCFFIYVSVKKTTYIYPLDDAYIHLAIAKNIAFFDTFGVTKHEFSSTSSSPLFTILNSLLIMLFGNNEIYPIVINILAGIVFLVQLQVKFKNLDEKTYQWVIPLLIWLPVIYVQVLTGMEHMVHIAFVLQILILFEKYLESNKMSYFYTLCTISAFSTMIRYESLFFIFGICVLLFLRKEYLKSITLGLVSLVFIVIFGIYSMKMGADFFPNSLLIKGNINVSTPLLFLGEFMHKFVAAGYLIPLIAANLYIIFSMNPGKLRIERLVKNNPIQIIVLITIILHASLASFGWLYRYDAYIKLLGIISLIPLIELLVKKRARVTRKLWLPVTALAIIGIFCIKDTIRSFTKMDRAPINIGEQQLQMAKFVHTYYNNSKVVANDIGAISYYSEIHLFDLVGLGNDRVQKMKRELQTGQNSDIFMEQVENILVDEKFEIALIYDKWFEKKSCSFLKVAEWKISDNEICGSDKVSFYAIGEENKIKLKESLVDFISRIDGNVQVTMLPN